MVPSYNIFYFDFPLFINIETLHWNIKNRMEFELWNFKSCILRDYNINLLCPVIIFSILIFLYLLTFKRFNEILKVERSLNNNITLNCTAHTLLQILSIISWTCTNTTYEAADKKVFPSSCYELGFFMNFFNIFFYKISLLLNKSMIHCAVLYFTMSNLELIKFLLQVCIMIYWFLLTHFISIFKH